MQSNLDYYLLAACLRLCQLKQSQSGLTSDVIEKSSSSKASSLDGKIVICRWYRVNYLFLLLIAVFMLLFLYDDVISKQRVYLSNEPVAYLEKKLLKKKTKKR